ncbi:MAG: YgfZ/GcvT domain-containing protein [Planctomycetota bacterium]
MTTVGVESAALIDLDQSIGTVLVSGADARSYLERMASADLKQLNPHRGLWSALLSSKGKLRAVYTLFESDPAWPKCGAGTLLIAVESASEAVLIDALASRVIREDVAIESVRGELAWLSVQGADAPRALASALGDAVAVDELPALERQCVQPAANSSVLLIVRTTRGPRGGFDLLVARAQIAALRARLTAAGIVAIDDHAADALRIEAGLPRFGVDATDQNLPPEAGYEGTLTYHKCYVGQEIVARLKTYGHVNRILCRIRFETGAPPVPGTVIRATGDDASEIGHITSSAISPVDGRPVALGYVRYKQAAPGARVVAAEELGVLEALVTM